MLLQFSADLQWEAGFTMEGWSLYSYEILSSGLAQTQKTPEMNVSEETKTP